MAVVKKHGNTLLLQLLIYICVLFPNDIFSLKKIIFLLLVVINYSIIVRRLKTLSIYSFFGFIFPILLFLYSSFLMGDFYTPFFRVFCCFMFLLLAPIETYNIDFDDLLVKSSWVIIWITLGIFLLDLIGVISVNGNNAIRSFFYKYEIGLMGKSPDYPGYYKIFMKSSPLLSLTFFYEFKRKRYLRVIVVFLSLLISGTRANMLFPLFMLLLFYYIDGKTTNKIIIKLGLIIVMLIVILLSFNSLVSFFYNIYIEKGMISDAVRLGHWRGLLDYYKRNPLSIITGTGMGSSFYSYGISSVTSSIELPYIDLFRQMGIILFSFFLYFIFKPVFSKCVALDIKCAYVSYLLIAATNPLLFSSTAFLVYLYTYYFYFQFNTGARKNTEYLKCD